MVRKWDETEIQQTIRGKLVNVDTQVAGYLAVRCAMRMFPHLLEGRKQHAHLIRDEEVVLFHCWRGIQSAAVYWAEKWELFGDGQCSVLPKEIDYSPSPSSNSYHAKAIFSLFCSSRVGSSNSHQVAVNAIATSVAMPVINHHEEFDETEEARNMRAFEFDLAMSAQNPAVLCQIPLFEQADLAGYSKIRRKLDDIISQAETSMSFVHDWFDGLLSGHPMDWELQRRVALIDDAIWEAGPEAVAEEIERIRAAWLAEKLPQAERVEFNPDSGKFFVTPIEVAKPDLLGATLNQVSDALDDAMANPSNGLHDRSREVRVLQRVFTKYGNDPQQIEMSLVGVYGGLTRQILSEELPPSEENLALQAAVEEGARAIRATHPEVAENRKILSEQAFRELPEGAVETLEAALPVLRAISEPDLAEDWDHDIPALINDATGPLPSGAPALPGADEATRIFSRVAKISLHLKVAEVIHKIDGSAGYKAARIITTVAALVTLGLMIF